MLMTGVFPVFLLACKRSVCLVCGGGLLDVQSLIHQGRELRFLLYKQRIVM